jgi:transcriptional regulator with XRE-family HTH domain
MYKYIGERIRKIRESEGVSQRSLGISLGLSDKAISSYESGRTLPPLETLFRISIELKKPIGYFIENSENEASVYERIDRTEKLLLEVSNELKTVRQLLLKTETELVNKKSKS